MKRNDKALIPTVQAVYNEFEYKGREIFRRLIKFALLLCAVIGMNILINGMLGINADPAVIILTAFYAFFAFYLIFRSVKGLISGVAILVFGMLITMLVTGLSPKDIFVGGFIGIVNSAIDVVSSLGYVTIGKLRYDSVSTVGIFTTVSTVTSVIVGLSCRKKTHVLPVVFVSAAICVLYVSLGGGIAISDTILLISSLAAIAVMSVSDYRSGTHGRSASVGLTALILAAAILLSPAVNVNGPMKQDGFFTNFYTALLDFYDLIRENGIVGRFSDARNASASNRKHSGTEIMKVYSNSNRPVYLRTWSGGYFDNDIWRVVKSNSIYDTDPYAIAENFIYAAQCIGYDMYGLGLNSSDVTVDLKRPHETLPVPSISARMPAASFPDWEKGYNENKYDGIVSLSEPYRGEYTLNSLTCTLGDPEFAEFLYGYRQYMKVYVPTGKMPLGASDVAWKLRERFGKNYLISHVGMMNNMESFAMMSYFYYQDDPYIDAAAEEIFDQYDIEQYYTKLDNGSFKSNGAILYDSSYYCLEDYGKAHVADIIKIVADYLSKKCEYSTNPKKTDAESVTAELLFGSKEGYCVQFATVGALIMRRLGFPTRYAEGYIARNFRINNGGQNDHVYRCAVIDKDAHAWCEVWIDGFGWMPAEMTPGFSGANNVTPSPETSNTETAEPVTTPEESSDVTESSGGETTPENTETDPVVTLRPKPVTTEDSPKENVGENIRFAPFALAAVIILSAGVLTACAVAKADKNKKRLMQLIQRGLRSASLNSAETERVGELLTSALARALNAYGILPNPGELPEDYGVRLDNTFKIKGLSVPPSVCVEAMSKQIYKGIMNEDEVKTAALTLQALSKNALLKLGPVKFVWYRLKGDI